MTRERFAALLAATAACLLLAGCLFRATEPPRFYRPGSAALDATDDPPQSATAGVPVRLGNVRAAPFLRERIVWRASDVEYGLYEQRRWFELPHRYVKRALASSLGTTSGIRLVQDATAARLDVEILAFDEVLSPAHEAHVALAATLRQGNETRLERTFAASAPIASTDGTAMAEAMGRALDDAAKRVASATAAALAEPPVRAPRTHAK